MLTRGKIRRRIGQKMAAAYSCYHSKELWPEVGERRSGTTADMIVSVLEHLQSSPDKRVNVSAHSMKYADQLVRQIRDHAETLGFDHSRVKPMADRHVDHARGCGPIYSDHYCGDLRW
jgi:hypothetical protein